LVENRAVPPLEPVEAGTEEFVPLYDKLRGHAEEKPDSLAVIASQARALSYKELIEIVDNTVASLRRLGVRHDDRVAVVLPSGPELALAIISLAAGAVCVPLNPKLADDDWPGHFTDLKVNALLTIPGTNRAAERAAAELDLPVFALSPLPGAGAGEFLLEGQGHAEAAGDELPTLESDAFVLPTSGTTSRPKAVPLTHRNLGHSAANTAKALRLTRDDRLLSVLPLHHAHGLISGLISAISAGSSIICMRGFDAKAFFEHLRAFEPTWYTAVPAIHQAILDEAANQQGILRNHSLRLVRSASASLPERRLKELEQIFGVPVIETYGMTEAASQIASNPLPPGKRKPGSVGVAAGPDVAILDEDGKRREPGDLGEIALRGPNITRGYDDRSSTAMQVLKNGWFRTGDLGYLDAEGYLYIVGRTKELINRGGVKIVPKKIEDVLLDHPDVLEAVAFAQPHPRLGEDVAAVVVLRSTARLSPRDLRTFALQSNRLTESEIPRQVIVVDAIPKSAIGKIQRSNMASLLGIADPTTSGADQKGDHAAPRTDTERRLAEIWAEVFDLKDVGREDDFFALGGDSLLAVQIAIAVSDAFGVALTLRTFFEAPTISELAARILEGRSAATGNFALTSLETEPTAERTVSISQEGILKLEDNLKGFPIFNLPFAFRLVGAFDPKAFERALKALIFRNDILRTVFRKAQGSWQAKPSDAINTRISIEDCRFIDDANRMEFATSLAADGSWINFDLSRSPAFRLRLLKFADDDHVLLLTVHHIIVDGWTMKILMEELFGHYDAIVRGDKPSLAKRPFQFFDFARWQRQWCESDAATQQLEFWKNTLRDCTSVFAGRQDAKTANPSFSTARVPIGLSSELIRGISDLCQHENSTIFVALLTGLKALLLSMTGRGDICVATPMANRSRPKTDDMIGLIENTAVIRTSVWGSMSFRDAMASVRDSVLDAHAHQELPFEVLLRELSGTDGFDATAMTDVYFSIVNHFDADLVFKDLSVSRIENFQDENQLVLPVNSARFMVMLKETDSGLVGSCIYKENHFDSNAIEALVSSYVRLLSLAASDPDWTIARLSEEAC